MRLKGQNFRVLVYDTTATKFKCIGMATSCTVNLTANTQSSETKDDVGGAAKPEVTSNSWSVQVESLNVADVGAMLTAIKSMTKFTLMWDQTSTSDNQTIQSADFARKGEAYLNDLTISFDDRTNSVKQLQFTGASPLEELTDTPSTGTVAAGSYTKGQFVRLFLSDTASPASVIAGSKTLSIHVSLQMESATTKDTEGTFDLQEPTGYTYDISCNALVDSGETITSAVDGARMNHLIDYYENSDLLYWQIANTSGANNRTKGSIICSGRARLTSLQIQAANRQTAVYDAQLSGYGDFTVGS